MKKIQRISLHNLSQAEMAKKEQGALKGGQWTCTAICGCKYAGDKEGPNDSYYGGSSQIDNGAANSGIIAK